MKGRLVGYCSLISVTVRAFYGELWPCEISGKLIANLQITKIGKRESSAIKGTAPGRRVAEFGVTRASAAAARVAERDGDGAAAARSRTSQGARRIRSDAKEQGGDFEFRVGPDVPCKRGRPLAICARKPA